MFSRLALALSLVAGTVSAEPKLTLQTEIAIFDDVGGLSGIEVFPDGTSGLIASDRGEVFKVYMERKENNLTLVKAWRMPSTPRLNGDVEGVATLDGKTFFFSLEGPARVITLSPDDTITTLRNHPRFWGFESNKALEALAIDAEGVLFTLPEIPTKRTNLFSLFSYEDDEWNIVAGIPQYGAFQMVGADFGPDGLLYTLERALTPFGFRSLIRRFDLDAPDLGEQVLLATSPLDHDNLEGISVWVDSDGKTRITMVSDNNFSWLLSSKILEYILQE